MSPPRPGRSLSGKKAFRLLTGLLSFMVILTAAWGRVQAAGKNGNGCVRHEDARQSISGGYPTCSFRAGSACYYCEYCCNEDETFRVCAEDVDGSVTYCANFVELPDPPSPSPPSPPGPVHQNPGTGSPIVLDLDGGGFRFTGLDDPVRFDIDADGRAETLGWTERDGGDALLALDRNGNGRIDDGAELFGNYTPLSDGSRAAHGYEALAELDRPELGGDASGWLDAGDEIWSRLRLWTDLDHNGRSEPEELLPLSSARVLKLGFDCRESRRHDRHGNLFRFYSSAWMALANGRERRIFTVDVFFVVRESRRN